MATTYKTKDGSQAGFVPGIGEIIDGKITVPDGVVIENANLEIAVEQPAVQPEPVFQLPAQPVVPVGPFPQTATVATPMTAPVDNQINKEVE